MQLNFGIFCGIGKYPLQGVTFVIQNLNKLSFSDFGAILSDHSENRGFPAGAAWQEALYPVDEAHVAVCRSEGPVYLDFEDGMTVLAVGNGDEPMRCFYLDKPVCLHDGVRFAIAPYRQQCVVRLCYRLDSVPCQHSPFQPPEDFKISHKLRVRDIYTMFYQEKEKGFFFKGEKHDVLELTYVDKGRLHSVVGGVDYLLHQGEMMVYGADQWHMQYADEDTATSFVTVTFDMENSDVDALYNRKFALSDREAELLQKMMAEQELDGIYSGDMILCLLGQLVIRVMRTAANAGDRRLKTPAAINAENEIISRSLSYVAEHVCEKLSVGEVARQVGVSPSHLTALFHKCLQIAPGEYIRRTKLEESKLMIREGRLNFTQIAETLSYSTVHHFSRQFKEKFGITPSEYAKAIK